MSSRFPIGVATRYSTPGVSLSAEGIDVDRGAELLLEELAQPGQHPLLELARALARNPVAIADLLQRERAVGQPALAEDGLLAPLQGVRERLELVAQELVELRLLDPDVRSRLVFARHQ